MKLRPEIIFGAIAAGAGVYVAWRSASAPAQPIQVSQLPPLQPFSSGNTTPAAIDAAPTYNFSTNNYDDGFTLPGITMTPLSTPPPLTSSMPAPSYMSSNLGPDHVQAKAHYQAVQQYVSSQNAAQKGGCSHNNPSTSCGGCGSATPLTTVPVTPGVVSYGVFNLATIDSTPQPSYGNDPTYIDSTISQYHSAAASAILTAQMNSAGVTNVGDVPTIHNNHLQGFAA